MEKSANEHGNWTGHSFVSHFVLARMGRVGREALTRNIKEELRNWYFFLTRKEIRFYQVEGESFFVVL